MILNYILKQNININEQHGRDHKEIFLQLDKPLRFRLNRIREIEELSIAESDDGENMSRKRNKYVTERD